MAAKPFFRRRKVCPFSGELDQLFEKEGVTYDKAAADKIREANG